MVVAVLGTTISPYLFFWQASQEVEEMNQGKMRRPLRELTRGGLTELDRIKIDTIVGMIFSNTIAFFIILTTAAVLNAHGVTNINSATQAAEALRPLAGDFTFLLFALGIIGTGLLAIPVLAGSAAYGVAEAFGWHATLEAKAPDAVGFYTIIAVVIVTNSRLMGRFRARPRLIALGRRGATISPPPPRKCLPAIESRRPSRNSSAISGKDRPSDAG